MEDSATEESNKDAPVLVDIDSILQQSKSAHHEQIKEVESAPLQFVCSSCPRAFSSKMKRVMHEKLHMQNRGFSSQMKSKLKELTSKDMAVVNASCASSNKNSLLCTECNVYFRTSREKQDHGCNNRNPGLIDTKCITCQKYFRPEDSRIKRCLKCKRSEKTKTKKHQKHKEEIREINGRKVKVIMVNNVNQLDNLNLQSSSKGKDPLSEPTPNLLTKVDVAKTHQKKLKRRRRNSPPKGSNKKSCIELPTADRPDEANSPVLSDPDERPKVKFQCLDCSASFIFPNLLEAHCRDNHGRFFYCHFCFLMFANKVQLDIHRIECTRKKIDPKVRDSLNFVFDIEKCTCTMCDLTLENHKQLLLHAKSYHSHKFQTETDWILEASASCCGLSFPTRAVLVHHKKSEHGALEELPEVVDVPCPKDTAQMEYLTETLTRLKMISFKCPLCPIVNYSEVADKIHQRIVHGAAK